MKSEITKAKRGVETITNQNTALEGNLVEEKLILIDDVMTTTQESFEKRVLQIVFLNPWVDLNDGEASLGKSNVDSKLVVASTDSPLFSSLVVDCITTPFFVT